MTKPTESNKRLSGTQIGAENLLKLQEYFLQIERAGGQVPLTKDGRPNLSAIALNCGFDRQVLYTNAKCKELIQTKLGAIGGSSDIVAPSAKVAFDPKEKRIRELEKQVADLTERLAQTEKQLAEAQPYQKLYQHACDTGRTLVP